jgi:glucose 1-dehydrogenase
MKRLQGKVALVTGAGQGIGRGIALCLATEGADLVVNDYSNLEGAQEVAAAIAGIGQKALVWQADVANPEAVAGMIAGAVECFGRVDIAIANAGLNIREPVLETHWENALHIIGVSQFGVYHTCRLAAQQMVKQALDGRRGGKIVIIGSIHAEVAPPNSSAYNMAKAAINQLGRTMALELAAHHINVNVVNPGWIDTPGQHSKFSDEQLQRGSQRIPCGRLGTPDDIGKVVAFLSSDEADYVTGATLRVDGGFVLGLRYPLED